MRDRTRLLSGAAAATVVAGTLLLATVPASAGGFCGGVPATEGVGTTVVMQKDCFSPTVLRAPAGETISFVNRDPERHTVTGVGEWGLEFRHKEIAPGEALAVQLEAEGIYVYSCLIHPGMAGVIVVGDATGPGAAEGSGTAEIAPPDSVQDTAEDLGEIVDDLPAANAGGLPGLAFPVLGAVAAGGAGYLLGRIRRRP